MFKEHPCGKGPSYQNAANPCKNNNISVFLSKIFINQMVYSSVRFFLHL